ncbi:MAG: hypothetical protein L0I76_07740 [Pseudonocardia sp.]|nr:hypothetical protein [Pseudonocardia sp.]
MLTPLAAQLAEQVEGVCTAAERLFGTGHRFEPESARRGFTLLVADYTVAVLGLSPSSASATRVPGVERAAPAAKKLIIPWHGSVTTTGV